MILKKIRQVIEQARQEAAYKVNETVISLYWNIGEFVSQKATDDGWYFCIECAGIW